MIVFPEQSIGIIRRFVWPTILLMGSYFFVVTTPRAIILAALLAGGAAFLGSTKMDHPSSRVIVRGIVLALGAFSYLFFLGGTVLPWVGVATTIALIVAGWCTHGERQAIIMRAQVLAGVLAVALAAAAAQFFFPTAWAGIAVGAIFALATLVWTAMTPGTPAILIRVAVIALLCSEVIFILRALPAHWVINGTVLTFAIAAMVEHHRATRMVYVGSLIILLTFGMW